MKIDILCTDGSPLGVTPADIYGEGNRGIGVGGSEYALLTMCQEWTRGGHDVTLFNNPMSRNDGFLQEHVSKFDPHQNRDVLITFRSPNVKAIVAKGKKVWWSCDQNTIGDFRRFSETQDKIVVISPFHQEYFKHTYQIRNTIVTDLPVREEDFPTEIEKVPGRMIFTSVPDRGLETLRTMWPSITTRIPGASLVITSDYRLWGASAGNELHRVKWMTMNQTNVLFMGALKRKEYITELCKAEVLIYPSVYDELFCIAVSEAQVAGAYPITSDTGALPSTNMGTIISRGNSNFAPRFVEAVQLYMRSTNRQEIVSELSNKAVKRFDPATIAKFWEKEVFN